MKKCRVTTGTSMAQTMKGTISHREPAIIHQWYPPTNPPNVTVHIAKKTRACRSNGRAQKDRAPTEKMANTSRNHTNVKTTFAHGSDRRGSHVLCNSPSCRNF